jgi:tRNA:m4X modification enzyme
MGFDTRREMMDIKDIDLTYFKDKPNMIGVAKHLCGGATDLALASFRNVTEQVKGLAIATCCHHLCDTNSYVNMKFITEELNVR